MESGVPTLREVIAGYQRFNEWEMTERRRELPSLCVEDALRQFFELCSFVRPFRPDPQTDEKAIEQKQQPWITLYRRHLESKSY